MVFGVHPVEEALASGNEIDRIFIVKSANHPGLQKLSSEARDRGISVKAVPIEKLHRLTRGNHQGVIAFMSAIDFADIESVVNQAMEKDEVPLIVVLDQITDVRNVGAIARSAECCG
ncbi:MAG: RNA methyltransferase substrate-binding domain-containing protein, partial [Schleiferiaceae bacterium]|nr:RNA methyltransferase substrate-binding domain-containing protein [Schleiferiaceae bacterium]